MIGELITGGVSLISGLFGRKKKQEKTTTESVVDYQKMASNAAAAGYNPMTAIRNGGAAGFTTTTTTSPSASALPGALQSIGGILGDAFSRAADPVAKKASQPDTALVDYQLRKSAEFPRAAGTLYAGGRFTGTKVSNSTPTMSGKSKGFIGPAMPEHLKLGVGKELPMYVWAVDDNGKRHRIANPDLPDLDQMLVPTVGIVRSEGEQAKNGLPTWWNEITHRSKPSMDLRLPAGRKSGQW
jgi:hypothetical protein